MSRYVLVHGAWGGNHSWRIEYRDLRDLILAGHSHDRASTVRTSTVGSASERPGLDTAYGDDLLARIDQGFRWTAISADTGSFTRAVKERINVAVQVKGATRRSAQLA